VPELDFAVACEHVRQEGGLAYLTAAGIDTLLTEEVPAAWNLGVLIALKLGAEEEAGVPTPLGVTLRDETGEQLVQLEGEARVERAPDLPPDWPARAFLSFNLGVVVPRHGRYVFEIRVGDEVRGEIHLRVIRPQVQADGP
jgi:hypothetical protein